jgi:hypothetical protein
MHYAYVILVLAKFCTDMFSGNSTDMACIFLVVLLVL